VTSRWKSSSSSVANCRSTSTSQLPATTRSLKEPSRSGHLSIGEDGAVIALHCLCCHWLHNFVEDLFVGVLGTEEVVEEIARGGSVGLDLLGS
jgi:hypothetical protein